MKVIQDDDATWREPLPNSLQTELHWIVPVTIDVREGHRLTLVVGPSFLKQSFMEDNALSIDGNTVASERRPHLLEEILPVAIVGLAANTLRLTGGNDLVAAPGSGIVLVRSRCRNHSEHVEAVKGARVPTRVAGEDDAGAAQSHAEFEDVAGRPFLKNGRKDRLKTLEPLWREVGQSPAPNRTRRCGEAECRCRALDGPGNPGPQTWPRLAWLQRDINRRHTVQSRVRTS